MKKAAVEIPGGSLEECERMVRKLYPDDVDAQEKFLAAIAQRTWRHAEKCALIADFFEHPCYCTVRRAKRLADELAAEGFVAAKSFVLLGGDLSPEHVEKVTARVGAHLC